MDLFPRRSRDRHIGTPSTTTVTLQLKARFILANPPFNISDWGGERLASDKRWQYSGPLKGQRQLRLVQHFTYHLAA